MNTLGAFYNKPKIKDKLIAQLEYHRTFDEIVQGVYWKDGRGCAIGCCTHTSDHVYDAMANMYNIEPSISYLIDVIFEGLPLEYAKEFPLQVANIITVGADLSKVACQMGVFILNQCRSYAFDDGKTAIDKTLNLITRSLSGDKPSGNEWDAAKHTISDAADAARRAVIAADTLSTNRAANAAFHATCATRCAVKYTIKYCIGYSDMSTIGEAAGHAALAADDDANIIWIAQSNELLRLLEASTITA